MSLSRKIFGTDGVRGIANLDPVTPENALRLGRAIAHLVRERHPGGDRPRIVIGKDTRLSGELLEQALSAGILSMGVDVLPLGVLPTPGVAFCTRHYGAGAGVVLSASHNPATDNGLKFFLSDGGKLDDATEARLENLTFGDEIARVRPTGDGIGRLLPQAKALASYAIFARNTLPFGFSLSSLHLAIDCANGASSKSSPRVLQALGAKTTVFHARPDGLNINDGCGSTHPEEIARIVHETEANVGIAHDGDADRLILCDENGDILDGDEIMAIAAVDLLASGKLAGHTLVTTVMSNFGLDETIATHGGKVLRTQVGDRYVLEAMLQHGCNLGGEQSGHLIFRDFNSTGDGLVAALQILRIMVETGKPLSELKRVLQKYPQAQRHLTVREKPPLETLAEVQSLLTQTGSQLAGAGRLLLRYSGTEPKIRLLIEGRDAIWIEKQADAITGALQKAIGI